MTTTRNRQAFDVAKALPAAWELLWADNLKKRAEQRSVYRDTTTYLTATDLEAQVRRFAQEQADGKAWGSTGRQWGRAMTAVRVHVHRGDGSLFDVCRRWLLREAGAGRLEGFNHGRGHVSGMRFRPRGSGLTDAERETMRAKAAPRRPAPVHWNPSGYGKPECTLARRSRFGGLFRGGTRATNVAAELTCARCRNLVAAGKARPAEPEPVEN